MSILYTKNKSTAGEFKTVHKVLDGVTIAQSSAEYNVEGAHVVSMLVVSSTGALNGVVTLEGSPTSAYTGTWLSLGTATVTGQTRMVQKTVDIESDNGLAACRYVRARVSTPIGAGSVIVYLAIVE